ncbi:MAG TPA: Lrp/AsnC family transcriptional regulator [Candidatus Bathyarchaeota archaeon]|nr:Lrp/AsnC family transcriptional regulator [Candidatus Bathyarchaeota archaeon]
MKVSVYILIQTKIGEAWNVAKKVIEMKGVKMAHAVTGIYDVIAYAELDTLEEIKNLITELHTLKGVEKTHTAVSF